MKTTLEKVRNMIAASMAGWLPEEYEQQQREEKLKGAVDRFLESNPDWKPSTKAAPKAAPVKDTKQKAKRIKKSLGAGAGAFTPHVVDEAALARARAKCREIIAADPDRYGDIITNGKEA